MDPRLSNELARALQQDRLRRAARHHLVSSLLPDRRGSDWLRHALRRLRPRAPRPALPAVEPDGEIRLHHASGADERLRSRALQLLAAAESSEEDRPDLPTPDRPVTSRRFGRGSQHAEVPSNDPPRST